MKRYAIYVGALVGFLVALWSCSKAEQGKASADYFQRVAGQR